MFQSLTYIDLPCKVPVKIQISTQKHTFSPCLPQFYFKILHFRKAGGSCEKFAERCNNRVSISCPQCATSWRLGYIVPYPTRDGSKQLWRKLSHKVSVLERAKILGLAQEVYQMMMATGIYVNCQCQGSNNLWIGGFGTSKEIAASSLDSHRGP